VSSEEELVHLCEMVEEVEAGYVLVCSCGWRSPARATGSGVGEAWDEHRGRRR
jgi:hypothetical protein